MPQHIISPKVLDDTFLRLCYINKDSFKYRLKFYSDLFKREIDPAEIKYFNLLHAQLVYRINLAQSGRCECLSCREELSVLVSNLRLIEPMIKEEIASENSKDPF